MTQSKNTAFLIDGGAGRVIAAIPALLKFAKNNPEDDFVIVVWGWESLLWSIDEFKDRVFSVDHKGCFENYLKNRNIVKPEPYAVWGYYNQTISLAEAFDEIINKTDDHKDLGVPKLVFNKQEELWGYNMVTQAKKQFQKEKTIVIQPYGQSTEINESGMIFDQSSRSLEMPVYLKLVEKLSKDYNMILFSQQQFHSEMDTFTFKPHADLRHWAAIINAADYFIGLLLVQLFL